MLQSFAKLNAKFKVVICINMIKIYDLGTDSESKVRYLLMLFRKHSGVEWGAANRLLHPEFHISTTNSLQ